MPPHQIDQKLQSALDHHRAGRLAQAESIYREILGIVPNHPHALHFLGVIALQVGRFGDARELISRAVGIMPANGEAHSNLGNVLRQLGRLDEAADAYRAAIKAQPELAVPYSNLAVTLADRGNLDEAVTVCRAAIERQPNYAEAHANLGNILRVRGQTDAAIDAYRQAIAHDANLAAAHTNLGNALAEAGRLDEAAAEHRVAIAQNPRFAEAHANLAHTLKDQGELDAAISEYRAALAVNPNLVPAHSGLVYTLHFHPQYDARAIADELRLWNARHAGPLAAVVQPHPNSPDPDRRLRIGYVSADFRDHVVGRNVLPLIREHDRSKVEITCYSNSAHADALTAQFRAHANRWRGIAGVPDPSVETLIRDDGIDVLVDLSMHLSGNRLLLFARKPAPVQATFAAYPGSTGLAMMDFRLSDPYLDPPGADASIYGEETVRLAHSFWCYDPLDCRDIPVNPLPALSRGFVTFGCLNNFCKINQQVLRLWARVLREVARSRLVLVAGEGRHRDRTKAFLENEGIDADRVQLFPQRPRRDYLKLYHEIDVGLDSFPYNGHTTTLDSLWMGVPVVTLVGDRVVGRAGLSQLSNLGMQELAAHSHDEYVRLAADLAKDLERSAQLRATLRARMQSSPLMNARGFAGDVEAAYREMWLTWCAKPPR